ncbi:MAG: ABC transporter substrate-binding protein [Clostridia bacterium]|jgi:iron complex transport system substrate-binding protein
MKKYWVIGMVLLLLTVTVACQSSDRGIGEVTDIMGRKVTISKTPEKIVSLAPSATEILFALGLGDRVVGVDAYSDYPPEAQDIERIGDFDGPNIEKILDLKPDLVIAGNKLQEKTIQQLEDLKVPTVAVEASIFDNIYGSIQLVGKITGAEDKVQELVDSMTKRVEDIKEKVKDAEKPTVYYVMSYGDMGNWTSGPGSFINDLMEMAGGDCITKDGGAPWMDYSLETLIERDPDILIVSSDMGTEANLEGLKNANGYKDLTAVKEGRVYVVESGLVTRPGPRIVDGLETIAKILHPDLIK